ncbi:MAG: hypothetical protein ACOYM2_09815 [Rectinemataceae bacterium]
MARAPFSVFKRSSRDRVTGKGVVRFVARFTDEDGNIVKTKTLEATNPTKAALEAAALRSSALSLKYVDINRMIVGKHLGEALKGVRLQSLNLPRLERIVLGMAANGTSPRA